MNVRNESLSTKYFVGCVESPMAQKTSSTTSSSPTHGFSPIPKWMEKCAERRIESLDITECVLVYDCYYYCYVCVSGVVYVVDTFRHDWMRGLQNSSVWWLKTEAKHLSVRTSNTRTSTNHHQLLLPLLLWNESTWRRQQKTTLKRVVAVYSTLYGNDANVHGINTMA